LELVSSEATLRSKRELIEKFIQQNLPYIADADDVADEFATYWNHERIQALQHLSEEENLDKERLESIIGKYLFTEKKPLRDDVVSLLRKRPPLKSRATIAERITG